MIGSERYIKLCTELYRGVDCCVLLFDVTSPTSFEKIKMRRDEFLINARPRSPESFPFILVGNKMDRDYRKVCGSELCIHLRINFRFTYRLQHDKLRSGAK